MNVLKGILLKIASAFVFALMQALVRWVSDTVPVGQVVFFRSAFAIPPLLLIYAYRGQIATAFRTNRPGGHVLRGLIGVAGMFFNFAALARLPLAESTAIGFAAPLMTVALAALLLGERVRAYRWSAVGVGFIGVLVMLYPHANVAHGPEAAFGVVLALGAAFASAGSVIQTRRLMDSETNAAIVLYFSLISMVVALMTLPWGWTMPGLGHWAALVAIGALGGLGHLLMTESFRWAPASVIAPFDYTMLLWAFLLGYLMFGEVPMSLVFVGAAIVVAAGLFVIWRERQLGLERPRPPAAGPPVAS